MVWDTCFTFGCLGVCMRGCPQTCAELYRMDPPNIPLPLWHAGLLCCCCAAVVWHPMLFAWVCVSFLFRPIPGLFFCGQVFFLSEKDVEGNRRRLEGSRRRLEGNHLDIWVALD